MSVAYEAYEQFDAPIHAIMAAIPDDCSDGYRCQGAASSGTGGKGQCLENGVSIVGQALLVMLG